MGIMETRGLLRFCIRVFERGIILFVSVVAIALILTWALIVALADWIELR